MGDADPHIRVSFLFAADTCAPFVMITRANTKAGAPPRAIFFLHQQTHPPSKSFHDMPNNELIRTRRLPFPAKKAGSFPQAQKIYFSRSLL